MMTIFSVKNILVGVALTVLIGFYLVKSTNTDISKSVSAEPALASETVDTVMGNLYNEKKVKNSLLIQNSPAKSVKAAVAEASKDVKSTESVTTGSARQNKQELLVETAYLASEHKQTETAFLDEPYDANWAPAIETEVWSEFESAGLQESNLDSVDCRTSLCRIEISHKDQQAQGDFLIQIAEKAKGRQGSIHHIEGGDSLATLIYLSR